jgi:hypothetical protein
MEWVEGESLFDRIENHATLPPPEAAAIVRQVAEALDREHQKGLTYGILTPRRILLRGADGKLSLAGPSPDSDLFSEQASLSPWYRLYASSYLAPEQVKLGKRDPRSDVFALGAILWELLAGRRLFEAESAVAVLSKIARADPRPLSAVRMGQPAELERIIMKSLAALPDERYGTGGELASALNAFVWAWENVPEVTEITKARETTGHMGSIAADETISQRTGRLTQQTMMVGSEMEMEASAPAPESESELELELELDTHDDSKELEPTIGSSEGDLRAPYLHENVQFTVYRPKALAPGRWYRLLAFAHLADRAPGAPHDEPHPLEEVARQAMQILDAEYQEFRTLTEDSRQAVPGSSLITFIPEVPGVVFNPPIRSFRWEESIHREEFRLRASPSLKGPVARGRLSVLLGSILLAEVTLAMGIASEVSTPGKRSSYATDRSQAYRKIFPSYSHNDGAIVVEFHRYATALGDRYLRDTLELRAGQVWNERLLALIREADVFQLFWSHNSMRSSFVRHEWEYALSLRREHFVRPTYWEQPLPSSPEEGLPPDELARLHFQWIGPIGGTSLPERPPSPPRATRAPPPPISHSAPAAAEYETSRPRSTTVRERKSRALSAPRWLAGTGLALAIGAVIFLRVCGAAW